MALQIQELEDVLVSNRGRIVWTGSNAANKKSYSIDNVQHENGYVKLMGRSTRENRFEACFSLGPRFAEPVRRHVFALFSWYILCCLSTG